MPTRRNSIIASSSHELIVFLAENRASIPRTIAKTTKPLLAMLCSDIVRKSWLLGDCEWRDNQPWLAKYFVWCSDDDRLAVARELVDGKFFVRWMDAIPTEIPWKGGVARCVRYASVGMLIGVSSLAVSFGGYQSPQCFK